MAFIPTLHSIHPSELSPNELAERSMTSEENIFTDHTRQIKHLPVDSLENLGQVKESPQAEQTPFDSREPFPLDPADFTDEKDFVVEPEYFGFVCYHKDHDFAPDAKNDTWKGYGKTEAEAIRDYHEMNDRCGCGRNLDADDNCGSCDLDYSEHTWRLAL